MVIIFLHLWITDIWVCVLTTLQFGPSFPFAIFPFVGLELWEIFSACLQVIIIAGAVSTLEQYRV